MEAEVTLLWKDIPSLISLRAFYSLSKKGSFTAAAADLNVTHTAISQHVRALESHLGTKLVERTARGMALNDDGKVLATFLDEGFAKIFQGVEVFATKNLARPLRVSTTPSFAENWLLPRLGKFWQSYPDIDVSILPSTNTVDLSKDQIDLAIRYGKGDWPDLDAEKLVSADFDIVASPTYFGESSIHPSWEQIGEATWLFETGRPESRLWIQSLGIEPGSTKIKEFPTSSMVASAAREGIGVAAFPRALMERYYESGHLVPYYQQKDSDLAYHMIQERAFRNPRLDAFVKWLKCCG